MSCTEEDQQTLLTDYLLPNKKELTSCCWGVLPMFRGELSSLAAIPWLILLTKHLFFTQLKVLHTEKSPLRLYYNFFVTVSVTGLIL